MIDELIADLFVLDYITRRDLFKYATYKKIILHPIEPQL